MSKLSGTKCFTIFSLSFFTSLQVYFVFLKSLNKTTPNYFHYHFHGLMIGGRTVESVISDSIKNGHKPISLKFRFNEIFRWGKKFDHPIHQKWFGNVFPENLRWTLMAHQNRDLSNCHLRWPIRRYKNQEVSFSEAFTNVIFTENWVENSGCFCYRGLIYD